MEDGKLKEVYFNEYCDRCKYRDLPASDEPCFECLDFPARENSHKPAKFEERDDK